MTDEKKNRNNKKEQITFYETFDDEIVRIDRQVSLTPTEIGGPRLSYAPTPVIPGFYTLSDAFENARRKLEAEAERAIETEETHFTTSDEISGMERFVRSGDSIVQAVAPGHFSGRSQHRYDQIQTSEGTSGERTSSGIRLKSDFASNQRKHYIPADELIEELTDDEIVTEQAYSDEQRIRQSQCFDFILDETMRSLIADQEQTKVKLG